MRPMAGPARSAPIRATADLLRAGMKMFLETRKETNYKLNALIDAQIRGEERQRRHEEAMRKSDEKFNRLLEMLRRKNPNGRG